MMKEVVAEYVGYDGYQFSCPGCDAEPILEGNQCPICGTEFEVIVRFEEN